MFYLTSETNIVVFLQRHSSMFFNLFSFQPDSKGPALASPSRRFTLLLQHGLPHSSTVCSRLRPPLVATGDTISAHRLHSIWNQNVESLPVWAERPEKTKAGRWYLQQTHWYYLFMIAHRPHRVPQPHVYTFLNLNPNQVALQKSIFSV